MLETEDTGSWPRSPPVLGPQVSGLPRPPPNLSGCRRAMSAQYKGLSRRVGTGRAKLLGLSRSGQPLGLPPFCQPRLRRSLAALASARELGGSALPWAPASHAAGPAASPECKAGSWRCRVSVQLGEEATPAAQAADLWTAVRAGLLREATGAQRGRGRRGGRPGLLHLEDCISCLFCGAAG